MGLIAVRDGGDDDERRFNKTVLDPGFKVRCRAALFRGAKITVTNRLLFLRAPNTATQVHGFRTLGVGVQECQGWQGGKMAAVSSCIKPLC